MTLGTKLLLGVTLIASAAFAVIEYVGYRHSVRDIELDQLEKAKTIQGVLRAMRRVYQREFLARKIPIDDQHIGLLPAHAISRMSAEFARWSSDGLTFNNVSDRPREPQNQADAVELEAIDWFRANPVESQRMVRYVDADGEPYYQFASPLRIVRQCLECHGPPEDAPATVRQRYDSAYDYRLGDLRGILSVKLPARAVEERVIGELKREAVQEFLVVMAAFVFVSLALRSLVLKRLQGLERAAVQLSDGATEVRVPESGADEIGSVSRAFNRMADAVAEREELLRAREARYRRVLDDLEEVVFRVDQSGCWQFLNRAWSAVTGYPVKASIGKPWWDFVHRDDVSLCTEKFAEVMNQRAGSCHYRVRLVAVDGTVVDGDLQVRLAGAAEGGQASELAGTIRDITRERRAEAEARSSRELANNILESISEGFLAVDEGWRVRYANSYLRHLGVAPEELIGTEIWERLPELSSFFFNAWQRSKRLGRMETAEGYYPPMDRWLESRSYPSEDGLSIYFIDVTERRTADRDLRLAATVFESTREGVMVTDPNRSIVTVNSAFSRITGYSREESIGRSPSFLSSGRHGRGFYQRMWETINRDDYWSGEVWNRRKNGEVYPEVLAISVVRDHNSAIVHYVGVFSDITALKESQERLSHQAHHDPLTALPNRLLFQERLEHALNRVKREGKGLAVLFLDLDRFKNINDSLGHPVGDELLQRVAERLAEQVRRDDTFARLGGDEFILLMEAIRGGDEVAAVAEKLLTALVAPFEVRGHEIYLTTSIGISLYPDDGEEAAILIKNADAAMYRAKDRGRNLYQFWTNEFTVTALEHHRLETQLRRALERRQLMLMFQPQVDGTSGDLVGVEALVRWDHPDLGLVEPGRFIPLAEESDLIVAIGDWVMRAACAQLAGWQKDGLTGLVMGVNLSSRQVVDPGFSAKVADVVRETGVDPAFLELEITETSLIPQAETVEKVLDEVKAIGVSLAVDDFGTGYSSLGYLKRFSVDTLKIDRSFVTDLLDDPDDAAIVRAILAMGKRLNLAIVAEGVENQAQRDFLRAEGCDRMQGYLFGRPMAAERFADRLRGAQRLA